MYSLRDGTSVEGDPPQGRGRRLREAHRRERWRVTRLGPRRRRVRHAALEPQRLAALQSRCAQLVRSSTDCGIWRVDTDRWVRVQGRQREHDVEPAAHQDDDRVPRPAGDVHLPRRRHDPLVVRARDEHVR